MKKIIYYLKQFPEYYLAILVLYLGFIHPYSIHILSIVLALVFTLQIIYKKRTSGMVLSILIGLTSAYFLLALMSEYREFERASISGDHLIAVGFPIIALNFIAAGIMFYKYAYRNDMNDSKA